MKTVIAVDFDGTLCRNKYPKIGKPNKRMIEYIKHQQENGCLVILWSCRSGILLDQAVQWCKNQGLQFDAVNENLKERIELFGTDPRKIGADMYIDDKAFPAWGMWEI